MPLSIPTKSVRLEAVLREPSLQPVRAAAAVCHPHPQHGGTMDNRVVFRAAKAAASAGVAAVRFNFRGVGGSTGSFDEGNGEREDVAAVLDWLHEKYPGLPLAVIGFSFGSWVGLDVGCRDPRIGALVGLGLPLNFYDFEYLADNPKPAIFIVGTKDEFCPRDRMDRFARRLPATSKLHWVEGADHFFVNELEQVQGLITGFLSGIDFAGGAG